MGFTSSSHGLALEAESRVAIKGRLLEFGVSFLDDALLGIRPDDLILVGAPSGAGKTQFCVNLAQANVANGKRVHFFALEASQFEIERRVKYQLIANRFYAPENKKHLGRILRFDEWAAGEFDGQLTEYEKEAEKEAEEKLKTLFTFYKAGDFTVYDLIEQVSFIQEQTDLVIVDHVHYFDWEDSSDNRAIKEIAKAARDLCLTAQKPMVLVAHLRKKDRGSMELCASLDEFHGSSDLGKIATKAITLAPAGMYEPGMFATYFRTPKNRESGGASAFLGLTKFNEKRGIYEQEYKLGWANATKFGEIDPSRRPSWVGRTALRKQRQGVAGGERSHNHSSFERKPGSIAHERRVRNYAPGAEND